MTGTVPGTDGTVTYQWQYSATDVSANYINVPSGGTSKDYTTDPLTTDTWYRRMVTSTLAVSGNPTVACSKVSASLLVTVNNFKSINSIAGAQTICETSTANLTGSAVTADGTVTYQWQSSTTQVGPYANVSNSGTSQNYTTVALTVDTWYRRMATSTLAVSGNPNKVCDSISSPILVTVNNMDAGVIGTEQTICETDIPAGFTNITLASGDGPITYQWQISTDGSTFANISGATDAAYSEPSGLTVDTWYRRVANSTLSVPGNSVLSCYKATLAIKVTVNNLTAGTLTAVTICESNTATINGSMPTADGTLSYQWQTSSTEFGAYTNVPSGGTSQNYTTGTLTSDTWYRRIVTSTLTVVPQAPKACFKVTPAILVTVNNFTSVNTIGTAITICESGTAALTGNAVTADGTVTYQWQYSTDNITYSNVVSGGTSQNYTTDALTVDTWFRRIATSTLSVPGNPDKSCDLFSSPVKVTVNNLTAGTISSSQTDCETQTAVLTGTLPTADGTISYQWQLSTDNITYVNVPTGGTGQDYTTDPLNVDTWYRRIVTSTLSVPGNADLACSKTSSPIKVTINNFTSSNTIAAPQTICENSTAILTGNAVTSDGTVTYQWQSVPDDISRHYFGTAANFALFTAVGAFSNTGTTQVTGDVGTNAGAFTGFPPGTVTGQIHVADAVSLQAATDASLAYTYLDNLTCGSVLGATLGSGQVLTPNIYCIGTSSTLNGNLTLDGQGNPNAVFIFQIDGALSTGTYSNVLLINSASLQNVFWQVNGRFDLADYSVFRGTIVSNGAINLMESSSLLGRGLAIPGAISLQNNTVTIVSEPPYVNVPTGGTSQNYTTDLLTTDTWFQRIATSSLNGVSCNLISSPILVTVDNLDAGAIAVAQTICETDIPAGFTNTTSATGDGTITYQWQKSTDGSTFCRYFRGDRCHLFRAIRFDRRYLVPQGSRIIALCSG